MSGLIQSGLIHTIKKSTCIVRVDLKSDTEGQTAKVSKINSLFSHIFQKIFIK